MAKKLPVVINEDEFAKLIKNTIKDKHRISFLLGYGAGLRVSEVVGIRKKISNCCKADLESKIERIKDSKKKVKYCKKCKNKLSEEDIIESETEWQMKPLDKENIDVKERRIYIRGAKGDRDRVVPIPKGFMPKHLSLFPVGIGARALQFAFKGAATRAGLLEKKPDLHFHSLRHGFATQCVSNGMPIHHLRTLMGHSNISTTNIYLSANPQDALKSYEEFF